MKGVQLDTLGTRWLRPCQELSHLEDKGEIYLRMRISEERWELFWWKQDVERDVDIVRACDEKKHKFSSVEV
ncbi:hypothetical protein H5410_006082 [Solanum commersonii]|uniref:Uncharacterized protein n=1 Tax=Solanum commersonii TaxID=4109 RepID=A0A9J6A8W6_SOLCO|nr:hypothetical protein H5410_006082 [Solanum commersonii]